ncbi:MAG: choice-of-anchor I family protein [Coleofasciculaceae cyanobacterium]
MAIELTQVGTFETGIFDESAAEINAYDPNSQRLFVVNGDSNAIDILDLSDPSNPNKIDELSVSQFGGGPNSVAVKNGIVVVAVEAENGGEDGQAVFFDAQGNFLNSVTVGALPDMVTFTPDGTKVLVANEGEPEDDFDPQGSVSIIDLANGVENATVSNADFTAFDAEELRNMGVRIFPGKTVAEDVEPEYIAVSQDSQTAYVSLQENNALAVLDIEQGIITQVLPLGFKDYSLAGNGLDASDRDGGINITTYDNLFGLYQPDAIATFSSQGQTYIVTANEGDARNADERINDLVLDPTAFPNAEELQENDVLGRLDVSTIDGDVDGDGDFDQLFAYGGRSFSIFDAQGNLVFDSGDQFEQITAQLFPDFFNSDNDENTFDTRSDNKGPEPEGVVVGAVNGRNYAFVGLERVGGVMVYDVTDPANSTFVQYLNNRDFTGDPEAGTAGDLGPEGLTFISEADSPNGVPLLVVSNEVSGSTTVYEIGVQVPEDAILGTAGDDNLNGTVGDDFIEGLGGNDQIFGSEGVNTLSGGAGNDTIYGGSQDDLIYGGVGNDTIFASEGNNTVFGNAGDDTIYSGSGNDYITGGAGDDTIFLGGGQDTVVLAKGEGSDIINNFQLGQTSLGLSGGLTFDDLMINQGNGATLISAGDELLASINWVQAGDINSDTFVTV